MKKKFIVAIAIFLLLFSGSWYLNQKQNMSDHERRLTDDRQKTIKISNAETNEESIIETRTFHFMPREYIRIKYK